MLVNQWEVPYHLKGFYIPTDINGFIEGVYPSIKHIIEKRFNFDEDDMCITIGDFVIYMLESDGSGKIRYKNYDGERYPEIPYYKWFLTQLNYFLLKRFRLNNADIQIDYCSDWGYFYIQGYSNPEKIYESVEINHILKEYSEQTQGLFEKNAHSLYQYKMEGYTNLDIAGMLKVSDTTITNWLRNLQALLRKFINR